MVAYDINDGQKIIIVTEKGIRYDERYRKKRNLFNVVVVYGNELGIA